MAARKTPRAAEVTGRRIRARNKAKILDAAVEVFVAKGFDGTSIAEIASLAGLPKANVYYYFKTKKAIYTTLIAELIHEWDEALAQIDADRDPADALSGYIRAKLDFSRKYPLQSKLVANEAVHGGRFLTRQDHAHMKAITVEKAKVMEGWAKAGKMDPVDPMHLFILLWATTQFYADSDILAANALGSRKVTRADYERAAETITAIILKGLGLKARKGQ